MKDHWFVCITGKSFHFFPVVTQNTSLGGGPIIGEDQARKREMRLLKNRWARHETLKFSREKSNSMVENQNPWPHGGFKFRSTVCYKPYFGKCFKLTIRFDYPTYHDYQDRTASKDQWERWTKYIKCYATRRIPENQFYGFFRREAARECRRKKKEYIKCLENRVAVLENQNKALIEELKSLKELYCQQKQE